MKPLQSYAGTPIRSGAQTPVTKDEYNAGLASDELHARLEALSLGEQQATTKRDAFNKSVEWLATDRTKASLEERENSLLTVLSVLANKYEPELIDFSLIQSVSKAFLAARSEVEAVVSLQIMAVSITQLDETHDNYDQCHELFSSFVPRVLKKIQDKEAPISQRAQMVTGYSVLQYFINFGGGGFHVDPLCEELISIAEATTSTETPLVASSLMGLGLLMTLSKDADAIIEELEPTMSPFLEMVDQQVRISAAKLVGLFYEKYQLRELDATDTKELLESLLSESARKTGKKDQHMRKSVLRDALRCVEKYEDHENDKITLTRLNLSRTKSIAITSWSDLFIIQHLKWTFGPGLHTQLANNPLVESIFTDEQGEPLLEPEAEEEFWTEKPQRAVNRRKERLEKLDKQGLLGTD